MRKRLLSLFLVLCMMSTMLPSTAFAAGSGVAVSGTSSVADSGKAPVCDNHKQHDENCGYIEAKEEQPCSHLLTDGTYSCAPSVSGNEATPSDAEEDYVCPHDDGCGFAEIVEGVPCTHECELCDPTSGTMPPQNNSTDLDDSPVTEDCACTVLCTVDAVNSECAACSIENADLSTCLGVPINEPRANTGLVERWSSGVKVGSYTTLADAVKEADSSDTLKIMDDIDLGSFGVEMHKTIILDLNGNTITYSGGNTAITVAEQNELFIRGNGTILATNGIAITNYAQGSVIVEGGTVSATGSIGIAIENAGIGNEGINRFGRVIVKGGTVSATGDNGKAIYNATSKGIVTIEGGTVSAITGCAIYNRSTGTVTISGSAVVTSANPSNSDGTIYLNKVPTPAATVLDIQGGTVENTADNGYAVYFYPNTVNIHNLSSYYTHTSGTVGKVYPDFTSTIYTVELWRNGSLVKTYDTLADAITAAAASGDTLKIMGAIDLRTSGVSISGKNLTLDLNGNTVTHSGTSRAIYLNGNASLTVTDSATGGTVSAPNGTVIYNNSNGTVTIEGGTISVYDGRSIWNHSTGLVIVEGGTVSATNGVAIWNNSTGTVTVSDGTISAKGDNGTAIRNNSNGTVTVSGGTVSATGDNGRAIHNDFTGTVTIEGGAVSAATGYAVYNYDTGKITVSGNAVVTSANPSNSRGTIYLNRVPTPAATVLDIQGGTVENTADNGYAVYFDPDTVTMHNLSSYYAHTGGTVGKVYPNPAPAVYPVELWRDGSMQRSYATLPDAITAAAFSGDTLKIVNDIDLGTNGVSNSSKDLTLDLNGNTVTYSGASEAIHLNGNASLTVTDSATGGTVSAPNGTVIYNNSTGTVTIEGGTILVYDGRAIYNASTGTVTKEGGTVSATTGTAIYNSYTGTVTVSGGTVSATTGRAIYNDHTGTVTVSGGTVSATTGYAIYNDYTGTVTISGSAVVTSVNPSNSGGTIYLNKVPTPAATVLDIQGGTVENTADNGYAVYLNSSTVTSDNLESYYTVAPAATVGKVYPNPALAVYPVELWRDGSKESRHDTLADAITAAAFSGDTLKIVNDIDLGTNGVSNSSKDLTLDLNGNTVTYSGASEAIHLNGSVSLTVTDGATGGTILATNGSAIHNASTGTVTISDGTVSATTDYAIYNSSTGTITVSGGTVWATTDYVICNAYTGKITVSGGRVSATTNYAIYNSYIGTITVSGGRVSATTNYAIYNSHIGTITVSGGTVSATTGTAIYNNGTGKITVSGSAEVTSANPSNSGGTIYLRSVPTPAATVLDIQGGIVENTADTGYAVYFFTSDVTSYNVTDYYTVESGAVVGKVYPDPALAVYTVEIWCDGSIQRSYATLADAVTAAANGDTLKIVDAIDLGTGGVIFYGKNLTLDLNGKTVTYSGTGRAISLNSNESLTVTDSATGGTITATGDNGTAIYNSYNGRITISGGRVLATTGTAIYNNGTGKITVSGSAEVTSANPSNSGGTIYLKSVPTPMQTVLDIQGGTVKNTTNTGYAVYFYPRAVTPNNLENYYTVTSSAVVGKVYHTAVSSVTLIPASAVVQTGTTQQFTATVRGTNAPAQTVTWEVTGNADSGTSISASGLLTVAADETAASLTVKAISTVDTSKSGTAAVTVSTPPPTVSGVSVTPATATVETGTTQQFTATVRGTNAPAQTVTWEVTGNADSGTSISTSGLLTVAADEMANTLTVTATSTVNTAISDTATVTVTTQPVTKYRLTVTNGTGSGDFEAGASVAITANAPANGKVFDKWTSADGVSFANVGNSATTITMPEKNAAVTATYKDAPITTTYTITFNASGGSVSPASATTGADGKLTILPTPTQSGYIFSGWHTAKSGGTQVTTDTVFAGNSTIYAHWTNSNSGGNGGNSNNGSGNGGSNDNKDTTLADTGTNTNNTTQGEVKVDGKVDGNGNATATISEKAVEDAIKKAEEEARKNGTLDNGITLVFNVATGSKTANSVTVNLPKVTQETIISEQIINTVIVVDNPNIKVSMDLSTIKEINRQAQADVNITAARMDSGKLTGNAKAVIGNRPVFDLTASYGAVGSNGGKQIQNFGAGTVSITIPYTLQKGEAAGGLYAVYVDGNGKVSYIMSSSYDAQAKMLRFGTNHFSVYGIGYKTPANFTDIANHWAKTDIEFVVNRGLMSGTSSTTFEPNGAMTRGMFVKALGRLAGVNTDSYKTGKFTDVKADAYYAPYVNWATDKGIVSGTTATTFAPDQSITRQEMAVIMANYAKAMGYKVPKTREAVTFTDHASIAGWVADAVKQMQMAGILNGKDGNRFDPTGTATHGEISAMLRRYVELVIDPATAQDWTQNDSGSWLYYKDGKPLTGQQTIDGTTYQFGTDGILQKIETPNPDATQSENKNYILYMVKEGETPWALAKKYNCTVAEIAALNGIDNPALIVTGKQIKIPKN